MTPDESFAKKERLVKTGEFRRVYKSGRSFKKGFAVLRISPNGLGVNRIGFSISSRVVKKAHARNRIRRLFREVYRKNKKLVRKGFDMVLVIRQEPPAMFSYKETQDMYLKLVKDAGILSAFAFNT